MKELIRHILREHTREIILEMPKKISTEDFTEKAKTIHGDNYDYSKVNYKNATDKIEIICPKHGSFLQKPSSHLTGQGCPICGRIKSDFNRKKIDTEEFINRAKKVHGDLYDYSESEFTSLDVPVKIICKKHGPFYQILNSHVRQKSGCPVCGREKKTKKQTYTTDNFIKNAKKIHGDKYDYSLVDYKNSKTPVKIICPKHGSFFQNPSSHLTGQGCPLCANNVKSNTENFIIKAKETHGNKYDYSKVNYTTAHGNVTIICPKHGEFIQNGNGHLKGQGCPVCKESKGENLINDLLTSKKMVFVRQKRFTDCTNQAKRGRCVTLPFDFYLSDLNTIIEYDGQQHFKPVWGEEALKKLQRLDKIRNQYCKKNGIKLIRIPYTMKKEEIEPYILKELGIK